MSADRLYILIGSPCSESGEIDRSWDADEVVEVYPRFTFARSMRRAINKFRQILGPDIYGWDVMHVPPSKMTPRDHLMVQIFAPAHQRKARP